MKTNVTVGMTFLLFSLFTLNAFADEAPIYSETFMGMRKSFYAKEIDGLPLDCLKVENNMATAVDVSDAAIADQLKSALISKAENAVKNDTCWSML